ncbi:hypothetical protein GTX14_19355 [Streptomyces sp. SID4944]|nr:hypothetical protein [Streptomyces sp. SID4944]
MNRQSVAVGWDRVERSGASTGSSPSAASGADSSTGEVLHHTGRPSLRATVPASTGSGPLSPSSSSRTGVVAAVAPRAVSAASSSANSAAESRWEVPPVVSWTWLLSSRSTEARTA